MDRQALGDRLLALTPLALVVASVGAAVELTGGGFDIDWHLAQRPETFWTIPHTILYSGAAVVFVAGFYAIGLLLLRTPMDRGLRQALTLVGVGAMVQLMAGGFDQWWHATYGVDDSLSPPHVLLTAGMVTTGFGLALGLGVVGRMGWGAPSLRPGVLVGARLLAFFALWYSIWGLLFILTFPGLRPLYARYAEAAAMGIADRLGQANYVYAHPLYPTAAQRLAMAALFAAVQPFALVLARRWVDRPFAATAVAAVGTAATAIIGTLMATLADPSQAPSPFYLMVVVPGAVVDLAWWAARGRRPWLAGLGASAVAGGFTFLEMPRGILYAVGLPTADPLAFGLAFMAGGIVGGGLALALPRRLRPAPLVSVAARPRNGA